MFVSSLLDFFHVCMFFMEDYRSTCYELKSKKIVTSILLEW